MGIMETKMEATIVYCGNTRIFGFFSGIKDGQRPTDPAVTDLEP